jgi:DNA-binding GntR family transcriptional regulator
MDRRKEIRMPSVISDQIYKDIASRIVEGAIPPGTKLEEQSIANQFEVSRTPVREAFRLLAAAGLIESKPHRGVRVIDFDLDQLSDMFEAVAELEAICAGLCAERMTSIERKKLEAIHEQSRPVAMGNEAPDYALLNEQFHDAIREGAHNVTLSESIIRLRQRLAPFRQPWLIKKRDRLQVSFQEHEELVAAILAGDRAAAHDAILNHITATSLLTMEVLTTKMREAG